MKILDSDKKEDWMKLKLENRNDIWEIEKIIAEGDLLSGRTMRRKMIQRKDSTEKGNKRPVNLEIEVEKVKYHDQTNNLRITGPITRGPEDVEKGKYHTFSLEPGKVINIRKPSSWERWQINLIKRAYKKPPKILVCVLDRNNATIAEVSSRIEIITEIETKGSGKQYSDQDKSEYLGQVKSILERKFEDFQKVIVAGPGFEKDNLMNLIENDNEELYKKCVKADTSQTGETGVNEVIRRGIIEDVIKDSRVSEETRIVDKFFEELSKGTDNIAYGEDEVNRAIEYGAVKKLIVTESKIRNYKQMSKRAEDKGAEVMIISEDHESGEKLKNIGGIAALLRFQIN